MTKARRPGRGRPRPAGPPPSSVAGAGVFAAELDGMPVEVRFIQSHQAVKDYLCPGCNQVIPPGTGHVVVVPVDDRDDRRHWHRSCWQRQAHR